MGDFNGLLKIENSLEVTGRGYSEFGKVRLKIITKSSINVCNILFDTPSTPLFINENRGSQSSSCHRQLEVNVLSIICFNFPRIHFCIFYYNILCSSSTNTEV